MKENVVFEVSFGMETYGKVIELDNGLFQCYETPLYGGDYIKSGDTFNNKQDAINYLVSLT